ncbi:MAG TPA: GntR family transcriptional regulator, partial [Firmicutes bacterium]|nr:GntR family transcriptional regulator [Bacillota bacterium]
MEKNGQSLLKYQQVKAYLMQKMEQGEISYGEKLPSENELALQFKISRQTVRQAMGEL